MAFVLTIKIMIIRYWTVIYKVFIYTHKVKHSNLSFALATVYYNLSIEYKYVND